jgi:hypothetical protein
MKFEKDVVKKTFELDEDGYAAETIEVRFVVDVLKGQSYADIKAGLHEHLDTRFNDMFAAELDIMPTRVEEGDRWRQERLFEVPIAVPMNQR